jgi:hypothetical protein
MSFEKIKSELISRRRAFSLGLAAALSLAAPATMLTVTDADAQTGGMERRDERRTDRQERRKKKKKKKATESSEKK